MSSSYDANHGDYAMASTDDRMAMDDVSLSSNSPRIMESSSSGASVASRLGRRIAGSISGGGGGRKTMPMGRDNHSDLGTPLTSADVDYDAIDRDRGGGGGGDASMMTSSTIVHDDDDGGDFLPPPPRGSPNSSNNTTTNKSYISEDDPFYMFRSDLVAKLRDANVELDGYLLAVRDADTYANAHECRELKRALKRHVKLAESTSNDLETTVRVVEKGRSKFPHITDAEIADRRAFVDETKDELANIKTRMVSEWIREKYVSDERNMLERRRGRGGVGGVGGGAGDDGITNGGRPTSASANGRGYGRSNDLSSDVESGSMDPERYETLSMMRRQDETLDDLDMAVTRVSYMAETIHDELGAQNAMLKNLEDDLVDAEEQLGAVMGKLAKLLKTKSRCQLGLILILSLIVLVLFFLVLYT